MRRILAQTVILGVVWSGVRAQVSARTPDPFAVVAEASRLARLDLWPGFRPDSIPVAIYQDGRTLLFRHPAPPEGFTPVPGPPGVMVFAGRHPSVTANSRVELAGVRTATLMPAPAGQSVTERAGVLLHEAFHVFQRTRHPRWTANEVELFTYPVDEPRGAGLRRLETEALRRALAAAIRQSGFNPMPEARPLPRIRSSRCRGAMGWSCLEPGLVRDPPQRHHHAHLWSGTAGPAPSRRPALDA